MDQLDLIVSRLALTMGISWASGVNLYAVVLVLGILGQTGGMVLPPDLQVLAHPAVIAAAGFMYVVEFFADKMPGVDTGWDAIHTFIRIPAGALLAAGSVGTVEPALSIAAGLVGGGLSAVSHFTKAGTRVLINASPEPFSNWTASILEDILVLGALWAALHHPWTFTVLLVLFLLLAIWLLPKLWHGAKRLFGFLADLLGKNSSNGPVSSGVRTGTAASPDAVLALAEGLESRLARLDSLLNRGLISQEEYRDRRAKLLEEL